MPRPEVPPVAGASGDARLAVRRFVRMCVEVLNGFRPAAHLRRLALPSEAADVVAQGLAGARRVTELRKAAHPGPRRPARPAPVAVLKVMLCEPRTGAVEAAVTLVTGDRTWAMAFRLELHQQTWTATTLLII
ncbi:Rv3235 family protein [Actinoplanes sp. G11-F43]|uniref:Rv3235 family protein n=1 Tax=Actinoplanes sp. G11-F43 TaxID=3424130 RepID=UPI003D3497B4